MGNKYTVFAWVQSGDNEGSWSGYENEEVYRGESMLAAMWAAFKARRRSGCVTFEWR